MSRIPYWLPIVLVCAASQYVHAQTDSILVFRQSQVERVTSNFSSLDRLSTLPAKIYSRQDTSLAVQQLFADKRSLGKTYTMVGGCNLIGFITLPAGALVGAVGLVTVGLGAIKKARFRRYREEVILRDYQSGIPLPQWIQHRLKATYFG